MTDEKINLPAHYALERDLLEQLGDRPGHQRCVVGRDELLLVLHEVPKAGVPEREAIFFWRRRDGKWFQPDGQGLKGLGDLLDRYAKAIDTNEEILEQTDEAEDLFQVLKHAGPLTRSSRNMVVALEQVLNQEPDDRLIRNHRDRAREIERAAELLHSDGRETLLFWQAEAAEQHTKSAERFGNILFKLNLVTGFFLPLVALGTLFGMNVDLPDFVRGMFWWIFFGGLLVGGALLWYVAKERR
jgi:Mg2+ and Co2+ transporter CorA